MQLLSALCTVKQPIVDAAFARAWTAALKPYSYDDVMNAALNHARKKAYFPAVSDLTRNLLQKESARRDDLDYAEELFGGDANDIPR